MNPLHVTIIGAGPVGITTACTLKAISPDIQVTVLDKRPNPSRDHGLNIAKDSVGKIMDVMNRFCENISDKVSDLKNTFTSWAGSFIRTNEIENSLKEKAEKLGVTVLKVKEFEKYITPQNFESLLTSNEAAKTHAEQQLRDVLRKSDVIVGADGSHSTVAQAVMGNKLSEDKTLQYIVELKFKTDGKQKPRNPSEATKHYSEAGVFDIESMAKKPSDHLKPTTLHIFTDKDTYDYLVKKNGNGDIVKGIHGSPYDLAELEVEAEKTLVSHPGVNKLYRAMRLHLENLEVAEGAKISLIPMRLYQRAESYKEFHGKKVLLVGDANSGMVLERGFNKGLIEGAYCAEAIAQANKQPEKATEFYKEYQGKVRKLFKNEKWWAEFKSSFITAAILLFEWIGKIFRKIFTPKQFPRVRNRLEQQTVGQV